MLSMRMLQVISVPAMAGGVLFCTLPVLLLVFGALLFRARRRQEISGSAIRGSRWVFGVGLIALALGLSTTIQALPPLGVLSLGVASIAACAVSAASCAALLSLPLGRALRGLAWGMLAVTALLVVCFPCALWLANSARRVAAYSNSNEKEVQAALAKNPNDAAAHSSLAHLDMMRGDHAGEMAEWRQVLRLEPDNNDALLLLGGRLAQAKRAEEARPLYERLAAGSGPYASTARRWLAEHGTPVSAAR